MKLDTLRVGKIVDKYQKNDIINVKRLEDRIIALKFVVDRICKSETKYMERKFSKRRTSPSIEVTQGMILNHKSHDLSIMDPLSKMTGKQREMGTIGFKLDGCNGGVLQMLFGIKKKKKGTTQAQRKILPHCYKTGDV